jgi:hypothetical protein
MTAKIDGTNGLIQQYDYQVLTTAFTYTFAAGTTVLVINPAGTLATGTITFPAAPVDGMTVTFSSTQTITALTLAGNGKTIVSAATILPANQATTYVYRLSNTSWYPMSTVATNVPVAPAGGSIITSDTVKASTSGTSISFSSIPSWVKRVTIMLVGVSTNGTSNLAVQIGPVAGVETSGYSNYAWTGNTNNAGYTTEWAITGTNTAVNLHSGTVFLSLADSATNTWVMSAVGAGVGVNTPSVAGGSKAIAGVLSVLRVIGSNTGAPVDTFDAGSINILYE